MKKAIAILLVCILMLPVAMVTVFAEEDNSEEVLSDVINDNENPEEEIPDDTDGTEDPAEENPNVAFDDVIHIKLIADIANLYANDDATRFIHFLSNNVKDPSVTIKDRFYYDSIWDRLEAGRTYTIVYYIKLADGFQAPEKVSEKNMIIDKDKGIRITEIRGGSSGTISVTAKVTVNGTAADRLSGFFKDIVLWFKHTSKNLTRELYELFGQKDKFDEKYGK